MKVVNFRVIIVIMAASLVSPHLSAHESLEMKQRIARLEATVEELTFKLSEALEQRNNLRTAMSQALQAREQGKKVVTGCDNEELRRRVAYADYPSISMEGWLEANASNCTRSELEFIKTNFPNHLNSDSNRIINYEISLR